MRNVVPKLRCVGLVKSCFIIPSGWHSGVQRCRSFDNCSDLNFV